MGVVFSRYVTFSVCTIGLLSLLGPRLLCLLGHQRDQEIYSEVTRQDGQRRRCHILRGRADCFSSGQVGSANCCPGGGCEPGRKGLIEELVILQPNTGGEREVGGEWDAGKVYKASGEKRVELCVL